MPGRRDIQPLPASEVKRIAIVCSRYNDWITTPLLEGAIAEHQRQVGSDDGLVVMMAPGGYEVPVLVRHAAASGKFDAVIALGCIIKGETSHDVHIATAVSNALMEIARSTGVPIGFGILTVDGAEQAEARAGGMKGNKGVEAMAAALETAGMVAAFRKAFPASAPGGGRSPGLPEY